MSDGMTDEARRDRIFQRRTDQRTSSLEEIKRNIQAPDKKPHCPICGSETYEKKTKSNGVYGPGGYSVQLYCICSGCSVMFKDPDKFLVKQ